MGLVERGLRNSEAVFNRKPMRLFFHQQSVMKRLVVIGRSQYLDIGNGFNAASPHLLPPRRAGLFLRRTLSNSFAISGYCGRNFPRHPSKIPPAIS